MRPGIYQNTLSEILAFKKRFGLMFLLCGILLCGLDVRGQAPDRFSFQGVARDATGKILKDQDISLEIQILEGSPDGLLKFQELHFLKTSSNGSFNLTVGSTNLQPASTLSKIDWKSGAYFFRTWLDPGDGIYVDQGATQLVSVPYSMYSGRAGGVDNWTQNIPIIQTGTVDSPVLPTIGTGSKLIWYPKKAAFRSGAITEDQWEDDQIGNNSFAAGLDVLASGAQSVALGNGLISKANGGVVLGSFNNDSDNPDGSSYDRIFQIGNGLNDATRTNALTILKSGNVGIGSNTIIPEYKLDVGGRMRVKHTAGQTSGIFFSSTVGDEAAFVGMKTNSEVGFFTGGNWRFWVNEQGDGYLNGNIIQTSDRRLKRDFSPLSNSLSKLTNIAGQHYFWKDSTKSQALQTGLIAQEVEQYFPELVTTDEKGFKAVNYIGLIPHLIESVKVIGVLEKKLESFTVRETQMHDEVASVIRELRSELSNIKAANHSNQQSK